uniref:Reverse transcriptase domain-containing protein n=1 Tax=Rhizophagus irregularis (strain DAOM 181602 / DAOM 197198 / MUCL 43194) TaxID=747089 RepID=U9UGS7_RHIID
MWDVHKEEYDMENRKIINTFTNKTTGKGSRIDYIWVTENIFNEIIIAKIKDFSDIKTDHRMLLIGFTENLITPKMPFKKSINKRIIYEYSNTEEKEKESFDNELIDCASFWDKNWSIEEKWEFYERIKEEKIKEAVERRCEDLHSNQRRMIDSVMEKEIKKIVIDRLLTEDKDGQDILVTDEAEINKLTIEHFKNFAGIQNHDVELPDFWKNEYESKSNVEENIYQNVLDPINDEEWVEPLAFNFPGLSYMDDMNFISDCKDNLEKILEIADSFYRMNDIKINKEKSELLLRTKDRKIDLNEQKEINIRFGNSKIDIIPAERKGSIRILGVWFNAFNQKNHVLVKMKEEIKNFYQSLLLKKRLTDKQMVYIFNMLIVPRVKYCTQLIVLTEKECDELIVPFRKMFKNKLGLAITAPNAIVHMKEIYNVKSFHDNQLQAKITNFVIQINDENELGKIMEIRLFNLQEMLMLTKNPLKELSFDDIEKKFFQLQLTLYQISLWGLLTR